MWTSTSTDSSAILFVAAVTNTRIETKTENFNNRFIKEKEKQPKWKKREKVKKIDFESFNQTSFFRWFLGSETNFCLFVLSEWEKDNFHVLIGLSEDCRDNGVLDMFFFPKTVVSCFQKGFIIPPQKLDLFVMKSLSTIPFLSKEYKFSSLFPTL